MTASAALDPSRGTRTVLIIAKLLPSARRLRKSVARAPRFWDNRGHPFSSNHRCLGLPASSFRGHRGSFDKRAATGFLGAGETHIVVAGGNGGDLTRGQGRGWSSLGRG